MMPMKIVASYARPPDLNHVSGSLLMAIIIREELMKRATRSLKAIETFILVTVSCYSAVERDFMKYLKETLMINLRAAENPAIDLSIAWSVNETSLSNFSDNSF